MTRHSIAFEHSKLVLKDFKKNSTIVQERVDELENSFFFFKEHKCIQSTGRKERRIGVGEIYVNEGVPTIKSTLYRYVFRELSKKTFNKSHL